jgi:hypothetical protein
MEVENVLLAMEEKNKWMRRREKLRKRLEEVRKRKQSYVRLLDDVKKHVVQYGDIVTSLKESKGHPDAPTAPPLR